jgi:hypothetical protein
MNRVQKMLHAFLIRFLFFEHFSFAAVPPPLCSAGMLEALAELNDLSIGDVRQRFLWALSMVYSRNCLLPVGADAATDANNPSSNGSASQSPSSPSSPSSRSAASELDGGDENDGEEEQQPMSRRRRLTAKQRRAAAAASAAVSSYRDRVSAHESRQTDDMADANAPPPASGAEGSHPASDTSSGPLNVGSLSPSSSAPLFGANAAARGADAERFELSMVPLLDMVNHADPGMLPTVHLKS